MSLGMSELNALGDIDRDHIADSSAQLDWASSRDMEC